MKLYLLIFILLFTLNGCNKGNSILENAKNRNKSEINIIDTTNVIPQLKTLLREYIKTYPQFNNLILDGDVILYKENKAMNSDLIYLLGPTSMMKYGEYYGGIKDYILHHILKLPVNLFLYLLPTIN